VPRCDRSRGKQKREGEQAQARSTSIFPKTHFPTHVSTRYSSTAASSWQPAAIYTGSEEKSGHPLPPLTHFLFAFFFAQTSLSLADLTNFMSPRPHNNIHHFRTCHSLSLPFVAFAEVIIHSIDTLPPPFTVNSRPSTLPLLNDDHRGRGCSSTSIKSVVSQKDDPSSPSHSVAGSCRRLIKTDSTS
jgi:hypothetical protein